MEPATGIAGLNLLLKVIQDLQPAWKSEAKGLQAKFDQATRDGLAEHHTYVINWAREAHGFPTSTATAAPTIPLAFSSIPRRLGQSSGELDELDVLVRDRHTALLGDPGAGKTTTLRRLANHVALEPDMAAGDDFRFVLLIVCREEDWAANDLLSILRSKVGISPKLAADLIDPDTRLRSLLEAGALVIVDGLDEVDASARDVLEVALINLGRHLTNAKIIVSCRSGDYRPLEQFDPAEILPLTPEQIRDASYALLGDEEGQAFIDELEKSSDHPSFELADRPLFLGYMAMIFRARGTVPDRPIELYDAITRLVIQEWDEHRNIQRPSVYAAFTVDDKRRFLSDLALQLLHDRGAQFGRKELVAAYTTIHERYGLPIGQAVQVARELEGHTGLFQQVGQVYEFSHLSIQEYLAADSFVRSGNRVRREWTAVPAVAAVAVALAATANDLFIDLVDALPREVTDNRPIHTFVSRIALEQPRFVVAQELGDAMLNLLWRGHINEWRGTRTMTGTAMAKSVKAAIHAYDTHNWLADEIVISKLNRQRQVQTAITVNVAVLREILGDQTMYEMQTRLA